MGITAVLNDGLQSSVVQPRLVTATRSGRPVLVREVLPSDLDRLERLFAGLSPRSRRLRYIGTGMADLAARETRRLLDRDPSTHLVLVALSLEGDALGVAELAPTNHEPGAADIAAVIADSAHGDGLGTALLRHLFEAARALGYDRIEADVAEENGAIRHLMRKSGLSLRAQVSCGTLHYTIDLQRAPLQ